MEKLKGRKAYLVAATLLVIAAAAYFAARLLGQPDARSFYFKAESRHINRYVQWVQDEYGAFREKYLPYQETAYRRRFEFTADIRSGGKPFGLSNASRLFDLISKSKLVLDTKKDPVENRSVTTASLLVERAPFMDAEFLTDQGVVYFTVPQILPGKYFSFEQKETERLYDRFSIPVRPKKLVTSIDIAESLKLDEEAFDTSLEKLGDVFSEIIKKENVTYGEKKQMEISGEEVKGREVIVNLDGPAATELFRNATDFLTKDEVLLSHTYVNFAYLSELMDEAGLFSLSEYLEDRGIVYLTEEERKIRSALNIKKDMEGVKKAIKSFAENHEIQDGAKMSVFIDKSGNILKRELELTLTSIGDNKPIRLMINTGATTVYPEIKNRFIDAVLDMKDSGGSALKARIVPVFEKAQGDDVTGTISAAFSAERQDGTATGMDIELNITGRTDKDTLKRNNSVKFTIKIAGEFEDGMISGEVAKTSWKNRKLKTENSTLSISVNAELPAFGIEDFSADIKIAGEDVLGIEAFALPRINKDEVTDLVNAGNSEIDKIKMQVMASFGAFYINNKEIIDAILEQW